MKRLLAAAAASVVALAIALPVQALTPRAGGWDPRTPPTPEDLAALERQLTGALYTVTCGGLTATGWSADVAPDPVSDWDAVLLTTSAVGTACAAMPTTLFVRQGTQTFPSRAWGAEGAVGRVDVEGDRSHLYWAYVPMPRPGQWVGLQARAADGSVLPLLQRRIVEVAADTFTLDAAVGADYLGAPVIDNEGRSLGMITAAGTQVTGSPQYCGAFFDCTEPDRVWWDITAPSAVQQAKATGAKRSVIVTWKPVANDGGAPVEYSYSVDGGEWIQAKGFRVVIPAKPRQRVTVTIQATNQAGHSPYTTVSARAR